MDDLQSVYTPLRENEFRVLLLQEQANGLVQCELRPLNIDTTLAYYCLSYTWGDSGDTGTIIFNGKQVNIRRNLANALAKLHKLGHRVVWVDYLCINQADILERNSQVAMMHGIYEKAREVLVWLESTSDLPSLPQAFSKYFGPHDVPTTFHNQQQKVYDLNRDRESRRLLQSIVSDDYWGRAWSEFSSLILNLWRKKSWRIEMRSQHARRPCTHEEVVIQEIAVASRVKLIIADRKIDWSFFESLVEFLWSPAVPYRDKQASKFYSAFQTTNELIFGSNRLLVLTHLRSQRGQPLLSVLNLSEGTKQRDARDTIYSKLGLAADAALIVPVLDYAKEPREIFVELVRSYIKVKKSLDILCSVVHEDLSSRNLADMHLPSWVPDWRVGESIASIFGLFPSHSTELLFRAGADTDALYTFQGEVLAVAGFKFDQIQSKYGIQPIPIADDAMETDSFRIMAAFCRTIAANHFYLEDGLQVESIAEQRILQFIIMMKEYYQDNTLGQWIVDMIELSDIDAYRNSLTQFLEGSSSLQIFGRSVRDWVMGCPTEHIRRDGDSLMRLITSITRVMGGRRVVEGESGRIYLVPETTKDNDLVCVLPGCAMPMVFRKAEAYNDHYTVIGPCYADGIMHGEAMREYMQHSTLEEFHLV